MRQETQMALFQGEAPQGRPEPPSPPPQDPAACTQGQRIPAAAVPATGDREQRLKELGLRPGCAYVYRVHGRLYAWGDFTHCPREDVAHNIRTLASWLRREPRLWGMGKAYDADLYRVEKPGDWVCIRREVQNIYRERLFLVCEDGSLAPAEDADTGDTATTERR